MFQSMVGREWRATKTAGPLGAPTVLRIVGGDGGSRTPVQSNSSKACYVRVPLIDFPAQPIVGPLLRG